MSALNVTIDPSIKGASGHAPLMEDRKSVV